MSHTSLSIFNRNIWAKAACSAHVWRRVAPIFWAKLTSGRLVSRMEETHVWADARERELWLEFQKQMDSKDTSHWLYGSSGGNGRPVDLGYWMGFKISEAYFKNAADKKHSGARYAPDKRLQRVLEGEPVCREV